MTSFVAPSLLQSTNVVASNANTPSMSVRPCRFMGITRSRSDSAEKEVGERGDLTLGDLDQLLMHEHPHQHQHQHQHQQGDDDQIHRANNIFHNAGLRSNTIDHSTREEEEEEESTSSSTSLPINPNLRTSLRRIHLDLSGRVLSHVFAPSTHDGTRTTTPLFNLPIKKLSSHPSELHQCNNKRNNWQRLIPHLYLGADYDLDEVWYGATRWISRCSWGPFRMSKRRNSMSMVKESNSIEGGNDASLPTVVTTNAWHSAKRIPTILFPSSKSSAWIIDLEGEQNVFDGTDSTCRLRLIQSEHQQSVSTTNTNAHQTTTTRTVPRQISFEYDSPKYYNIDNINTLYNTKRQLQYAPTLSIEIQTPFLHRRIHLHTKKTWILKEGGDKYGNYYNGDYYTCPSNAVDRRWKYIKERYRDGIPKSNTLHSTTGTSVTNAAIIEGSSSLRNKLSNWLENDGWMPRRITTNLIGNLVSVSEFGLWNDTMNKCRDENGADSSSAIAVVAAAAATADSGAVGESSISKRRSWRSIIPPIHNAGIRLRISKKIDYTTLGIFPWSNNNARSFQTGSSNTNNRGWMEALQSTHVRLELCGLYGLEEEKCASIGLEGDPLDWNGTYKFTFGHEGVTILGK
ncbi:hypothetical protein ACHAWU_007432 [Discostella pseudostelligera]|uniref:Uncharacterized protein n=1 Tax=Discostella pseudostelligera TaxID=259834 RepID=A0ABD3MUA4_9STRA